MEAEREHVVSALYGAAMGNQPWAIALDRLCAFTDTRCSTLDTYDLDAKAGQVLASNLAPHPAIEEYNRTPGQRNILIETAYRQVRAGHAFRASRFVRMRDFEKTDLYNTVYRALGIRHVAGFALDVAPDGLAQFSLIKPSDGGDLSESEMRRLRELGPHLQQAWAGYSHLAKLESSLATLVELWNRFDHAVMVLDARLKLKFANRAAEALLADGCAWRSRSGFLKNANCACQAKFQQAVQRVLDGQQTSHSLSRPGVQPNGHFATLYRIADNRLALILTDPARTNGDFRAGLQRSFGLTPAEAKLVNAMISGQTLRQFADSRQIRYETARAHLKNAMRKNSWRRQTQMISEVLLSLLPGESFG